LAQRLVRKLCDNCKQIEFIDDYSAELLNINNNTKVYKDIGCSKCNNTGFSSRIAIGELLIIDTNIKQMIQDNRNDFKIKEYAVKNGMTTLKQRGVELLLKGETTIQEIIKLSMENE